MRNLCRVTDVQNLSPSSHQETPRENTCCPREPCGCEEEDNREVLTETVELGVFVP